MLASRLGTLNTALHNVPKASHNFQRTTSLLFERTDGSLAPIEMSFEVTRCTRSISDGNALPRAIAVSVASNSQHDHRNASGHKLGKFRQSPQPLPGNGVGAIL